LESEDLFMHNARPTIERMQDQGESKGSLPLSLQHAIFPAMSTHFKAPVREEIERLGYTIIANMGDQPSDLIGGHAEKKYLLPDPFYRVP
jgi:hypothetical protein